MTANDIYFAKFDSYMSVSLDMTWSLYLQAASIECQHQFVRLFHMFSTHLFLGDDPALFRMSQNDLLLLEGLSQLPFQYINLLKFCG